MITHNGQTYKVVVVTPAGRREYLSIFKRFIYRKMEEGLIDSWQLWVNTVKQSDLEYLNSMEAENPKVRKLTIKGEIVPSWDTYDPLRTYKFFQYTQDDDTIYIRFDDDIIWCADDALEKICQARIDHPDAFLIYPNVINSTIITAWHQKNGALSEAAGRVNQQEENPTNPNHAYLHDFNYSDSKLIEHIHQTFHARMAQGSLGAYNLPSRSLDDYQRFSICTIAWWGKDHIQGGAVEEPWLAWEEPERLSRPVWFCGDALLFHFSYHTQIEHLRTLPQYLEYFNNITK